MYGGSHLMPENIFYFSGMLETRLKYWFGYYEIKCRLPLHAGVKTSFWLLGAEENHYYEEIDILEHGEIFSPDAYNRVYNCGIHYSPNSSNFENANHSVCLYYHFANGVPDVTHEHTYACEWLPDRIRWFFDGEVIFECNDRDEIPQYPMQLKVTHPVINNAIDTVQNTPIWQGIDSATIHHIKYIQLVYDCDSDVAIRNASDITSYQPGVKRSIAMGASGGLEISNTTDIVFKASEAITIDREFTIPVGAKVTMIVQSCPNTE